MPASALSPSSETETGPAESGAVAGMFVAPMPGDALAVRLYRLIEHRPEADLLHVLASVQGRGVVLGPVADAGIAAAPEDERAVFARRSLEAAARELGGVPSHRAYERWRDRHQRRDEFATASLVRRALGGGSWSGAVRGLGGPVPDVTARRLTGRAWFTAEECRVAVELFFAAAVPGERGVVSYRAWARAYSRTPGARRVPVDHQVIRRRLGRSWAELREEGL